MGRMGKRDEYEYFAMKCAENISLLAKSNATIIWNTKAHLVTQKASKPLRFYEEVIDRLDDEKVLVKVNTPTFWYYIWQCFGFKHFTNAKVECNGNRHGENRHRVDHEMIDVYYRRKGK